MRQKFERRRMLLYRARPGFALVGVERDPRETESIGSQFPVLSSQFSVTPNVLPRAGVTENREVRTENSSMPNPKRRHSQKRTSTRRAHDSLSQHSLSAFPNCHEQKMPHRACPKRATYKGREIIAVEEKS